MEKSIKFASIDIGSNAMRLLFCRVIKDKKNRHTFSKEALFRMPLRLGEDAFSLGFIRDKNILKLQKTLSAFKLMVDAYDPIIYRSCATAALRNAKNGHSIIKKINDTETNLCANAERKMLQTIGGDCDTAIGGLAKISNNNLVLKAQLFSDEGDQSFDFELTGRDVDSVDIGKEVGERLLKLAGKRFKTK